MNHRFESVKALFPYLLLVITSHVLHAAPPRSDQSEPKVENYESVVPSPTYAAVKYGPHDRHVMDFWKAESNDPTPLVLVIHGGGWLGGSKERVSRFVDVKVLLDAGISVAANNYRLISDAKKDGVEPPVMAPMTDCASALQFLRSKADEWKVDPSRIAAAGGSAGACTALWLAYHDDMAMPQAKDPVLRQSTRLLFAAVMGAQTTLDPMLAKQWIPNSTYGSHAFGIKNFDEALARRDEILPWIKEYSPYSLASKDDPPIAIFYQKPPSMGKDQDDPTHSANFGIGLQERCKELGIPCEVIYPGTPEATHKDPTSYLISKLKSK